MADTDRKSGAAAPKLPEGATNLHKNMATGMARTAAETKATKGPVTPKQR